MSDNRQPMPPRPFGPNGPYDPMRHHHPKHPPYMVDKCADQCDDQLPLFSQVGRGLQGDGYKVEVIKDSLTETILEGLIYDAHTGAFVSDWTSENINGGHISYQYNLRPFTDPQTFTITFKYVRPGRAANERGVVWSWTTPAIPYLWSRQQDGSMSDGEDIVGTGVATLYLKKTTDGEWDWRKHEKLVYPDGFTHEDMNAPDPLEGWTVNIAYGIGGDIDAPNIDDIAKILGISVENIKEIVKNSPIPTDTIPDESLKKYIDRRDKEESDHIHEDMGFGNGLINDGNALGDNRNTIKKYVDTWVADLQKKLAGITWDYGDSIENTLVVDGTKYPDMKSYVDAKTGDVNKKINAMQGQLNSLADAFDALIKRIYGVSLTKGTNAATSTSDAYTTYSLDFSLINNTQSSSSMIPMGNIDVLSSSKAKGILTHNDTASGDIKAN